MLLLLLQKFGPVAQFGRALALQFSKILKTKKARGLGFKSRRVHNPSRVIIAALAFRKKQGQRIIIYDNRA